jgi:D-glycero-D-manno-heptose 1,7-bisphosphate phosphatase
LKGCEALLKKVVFLDRDGTINRDSPDYIKSWQDFEFLPGSLKAIERLTAFGFTTILITNQSAVPRKYITVEQLDDMHRMMKDVVETNAGEIKDIFYCSHMPDEGCNCRKPQPGLIFQARDKYHIDLTAAVLVGDSAKDIECGQNAGCGKTVLVKTGNFAKARQELTQKSIVPDFVAKDLYEAAEWIIERLGTSITYRK